MADERESERERDAAGRPRNARPRDRFGRPLPRGEPDELAGREDPQAVAADARTALERAAALFAERRYFEAHEFLEVVWKAPEVPEEDRDFWKGVTQVAVGCVHVQRGNIVGARTLLGRAVAHLRRYPSPHGRPVGLVDAAALAAAAAALRDALPGSVGQRVDLAGFAFPALPLVR